MAKHHAEQQYLAELLIKKMNGIDLSSREQEDLREYSSQSEGYRIAIEYYAKEEWVKQRWKLDQQFNEAEAWDTVQKNIHTGRVVKKTFNWWKYAAIVVLIVGVAALMFIFTHQSPTSPTPSITQTMDIAPGSNKAVLTINGHQNIDLASGKKSININNTITYNDGEKIADAGQTLQLTTPRGGQYQAVLPDGSKVWLNAASSIKFPSKFSDKERRVEIIGEAYFEIAKDVVKPFKVSGGGQEIEVLGTSFNVNVYDDEPVKKTTLITGSIKITNNNQTAILKPGEQSVILITPITKIKQITVQTTNTEQNIAWISGLFNLQNATLPELARQLERWYDIKVQFEGPIPGIIFKGEMDRNVRLSGVLRFLSNFDIKARIEGRVLIIEGN